MRKDIDQLWQFVEPYVNDAGLELVELQFVRDRNGAVLRVFIDYPPLEAGALPGSGSAATESPPQRAVGLDECERVSRDLSAALDVADLIPSSYHLEVSSPGIERPLRRARDFARFSGRRARLRTDAPVGGRRNFSGVLAGVVDGVVEIDCDGQRCRVPLAAIARANLIPDWAAEFRRPGIHPHGEHGRSAS